MEQPKKSLSSLNHGRWAFPLLWRVSIFCKGSSAAAPTSSLGANYATNSLPRPTNLVLFCFGRSKSPRWDSWSNLIDWCFIKMSTFHPPNMENTKRVFFFICLPAIFEAPNLNNFFNGLGMIDIFWLIVEEIFWNFFFQVVQPFSLEMALNFKLFFWKKKFETKFLKEFFF